MHRLVVLIIVLIVIMSACSTVSTPIPLPTHTPTPSATLTVSIADITAAATYIRTLPPSFTPTFTPSVTNTPLPTSTPSATGTATPIPEDILCEEFIFSRDTRVGNVSADDMLDFMQIYIPYPEITIVVEIINLNTGEVVGSATLPGDRVFRAEFIPQNYPDIAEYEYTLSLTDATREGLCERIGTFDTRLDELPPVLLTEYYATQGTPTPDAEVTIESEATAELTEIVAPIATPRASDDLFTFPPR